MCKIKYYKNYEELKKSLQNKTFYIMNNRIIGRYDSEAFSIDIFVSKTEHSDEWSICYSAYIPLSVEKEIRTVKELFHGELCYVSQMPSTDDEFWNLINLCLPEKD